jgi:hypothetical protein
VKLLQHPPESTEHKKARVAVWELAVSHTFVLAEEFQGNGSQLQTVYWLAFYNINIENIHELFTTLQTFLIVK